jgi:hypothetical protein
VLVADRLVGLGVPGATYPVLAAAGLLVGAWHALRQRPGRLGMAVRLDRQLGLNDRLGTAEVIRTGRIRPDDFAALARRDAERRAESIDPVAATPIRITRVWVVAAAASATLGLGDAYLPTLARAAGPGAATGSTELDEQRSRIRATIDDALADVDPETLDERSREKLDALERLASQLEPTSEIELARARDDSAAQLDELADQLARQSQQNLDAVEEAARRFADIGRREAPTPAPPEAEAFLDALERGELGEAADRFDELMKRQRELPPPARRKLARQLREISETLERARERADAEYREQELREALRDLGVNEDALDEGFGEEPSETQAESGEPGPDLDEETLRRLEQDLERLRQERQRREQADAHARRLGEDLDKAADEIERSAREDTPTPPDAGGEPPTAPPGEPRPDGQPTAPKPTAADRDQAPRDKPRTEGPVRTPTAPTSKPPSSAPSPPGERPEAAPAETTATGDEAPREIPGETPDRTPPDAESEIPQGAPSSPPVPDRTAPPSTPAPAPPGPQTPAPPDGQADQQPAIGDGDRQRQLRSVGETLRRLDKTRRDELERLASSERLRRAARDLADTLSDEEKERLRRQWLRNAGAAPGTEPGRPDSADGGEAPPFAKIEDIGGLEEDEEADTLIAEWLSTEPRDGEARRDIRRETVIRQAQSAAEQAVEQTVVPSRYHALIQRYFGRLPDTVERAASSRAPSQPAAPADDDGS